MRNVSWLPPFPSLDLHSGFLAWIFKFKAFPCHRVWHFMFRVWTSANVTGLSSPKMPRFRSLSWNKSHLRKRPKDANLWFFRLVPNYFYPDSFIFDPFMPAFFPLPFFHSRLWLFPSFLSLSFLPSFSASALGLSKVKRTEGRLFNAPYWPGLVLAAKSSQRDLLRDVWREAVSGSANAV